jgi:hypothetical protein
MISPENAQALLQKLMENEPPLVGLLLLDFKQQMVLSALMPPEVDILKFAGLVYRGYQVREQLFALMQSPAEHTLFWGENYAIVVQAATKQPLLLAGIVALPAQVGVALVELKRIIEAFETE